MPSRSQKSSILFTWLAIFVCASTSFSANALGADLQKQCRDVFVPHGQDLRLPEHFITAAEASKHQRFNLQPTGIFKKIKDALVGPTSNTATLENIIVIEDSLRKVLSDPDDPIIQIRVLFVLKGRTRNRLISGIHRAYMLKTTQTEQYWQTASHELLISTLTGHSSDVLRFLQNDFAKKSVFWAGIKGEDSSFYEMLNGWLMPSYR